jgi:hypothetical protein
MAESRTLPPTLFWAKEHPLTNPKFDRYPSLQLYETNGVPYILSSDLNHWKGPLWTGHCMMLDPTDMYGDSGFFHELCHWAIATPSQRIQPDFLLGKQVNAGSPEFTTNRAVLYPGDSDWSATNQLHKTFDRKGANRGWGHSTIALSTASRQEHLACVALCFYEPMCGIWPWDGSGITDQFNTAMDDYGGYRHYWDPDKPSLKTIRATHRRILSVLRPSVTEEQVLGYWNALRSFREEEMH